MAYSVLVAESADREVDNALGYIARTFCSPQAVARLLAGYERALRALAAFPLAYPVDLPVSSAVGTEVRKILVGGHKLLYTVDEAAGRVDVVSFLHTRQDAPARFLEDWEGL